MSFVPKATQHVRRELAGEDGATLEQLPGGRERGLLLAEQEPEEKRKHSIPDDAGKRVEPWAGLGAEGDNMEVAENDGRSVSLFGDELVN